MHLGLNSVRLLKQHLRGKMWSLLACETDTVLLHQHLPEPSIGGATGNNILGPIIKNLMPTTLFSLRDDYIIFQCHLIAFFSKQMRTWTSREIGCSTVMCTDISSITLWGLHTEHIMSKLSRLRENKTKAASLIENVCMCVKVCKSRRDYPGFIACSFNLTCSSGDDGSEL